MVTDVENEEEVEKDVQFLSEYSDEILARKEEIEQVFQQSFNNSIAQDGFEEYFEFMQQALAGVIEDDEDRDKVCDKLLRISSGISVFVEEEIRKEDENLSKFIRKLSRRHSREATRRLKILYQGRRWWSDINTEPKFSSDRPGFSHEIVVDHDEFFQFDSSINSSCILAYHFMSQVADAPQTLGEDVLTNIEREHVIDTRDVAEELLDQMDEYEEQESEGNGDEPEQIGNQTETEGNEE